MPLELIVGAVVGAGLASEPVRKTLRKGLVYGLAGALIAYDKVAAIASEARGKHKDGSAESQAKPAATTTEDSGAVKPSSPTPVTTNATSS